MNRLVKINDVDVDIAYVVSNVVWVLASLVLAALVAVQVRRLHLISKHSKSGAPKFRGLRVQWAHIVTISLLLFVIGVDHSQVYFDEAIFVNALLDTVQWAHIVVISLLLFVIGVDHSQVYFDEAIFVNALLDMVQGAHIVMISLLLFVIGVDHSHVYFDEAIFVNALLAEVCILITNVFIFYFFSLVEAYIISSKSLSTPAWLPRTRFYWMVINTVGGNVCIAVNYSLRRVFLYFLAQGWAGIQGFVLSVFLGIVAHQLRHSVARVYDQTRKEDDNNADSLKKFRVTSVVSTTLGIVFSLVFLAWSLVYATNHDVGWHCGHGSVRGTQHGLVASGPQQRIEGIVFSLVFLAWSLVYATNHDVGHGSVRGTQHVMAASCPRQRIEAEGIVLSLVFLGWSLVYATNHDASERFEDYPDTSAKREHAGKYEFPYLSWSSYLVTFYYVKLFWIPKQIVENATQRAKMRVLGARDPFASPRKKFTRNSTSAQSPVPLQLGGGKRSSGSTTSTSSASASAHDAGGASPRYPMRTESMNSPFGALSSKRSSDSLRVPTPADNANIAFVASSTNYSSRPFMLSRLSVEGRLSVESSRSFGSSRSRPSPSISEATSLPPLPPSV